MNKREILELKKRFKKDDTTVSRVCGCYVDGEKNIVSTFNENFLALTEEDFFKYLDILKKSLSGKLGNNLFNIELSSEIEKDSGHKRVLMALRDSNLKNDDMLMTFYEHIIDIYCHAGNYLILLFVDNYDVMKKTSDNQKLDESEEVFKYIICAICPVDLSKPALGYKEKENKISSRDRDWVVGAPESAFMYPAFNDRSTDIDGALFYTKKSTDIHYEFITDLLGDYKVISLDQKRDHFMQGVSSYIDDDVAGETLLDIYSEILDNAHKEEKDLDDYKLSTDELKKVLTHHNISGYDADSIIDVCRNDSDNDKIKAEDIVDDKFFKKNELYIAYKKLQAENEQLKEKLKRYEQVG